MWGLKGYFGCKFVAPIEPDLYATMLGTIRATGLDPVEPPADLTTEPLADPSGG
jgi:hypothetical protein